MKRISSPDMRSLCHAVETSRETFVVSHEQPRPQICEVDVDGHVIHIFSNQVLLADPDHMAIDSDGRVIVASYNKSQILLLNSRLQIERILLDTEHHDVFLNGPRRLCYIEQTRRLIVAGLDRVQVYIIRSRGRSCPPTDLDSHHLNQLYVHWQF